MKKIFRLIWFIISDVIWGGLRFFLEIPFDIWREFNKKEKER